MGFFAATPIHTINGLVPIEQIKVGDLVVSKPESGEGETRYKPVVRTFSYDNKALYLVGYFIMDENLPEGGKIERVMVTGNHPFWVKGLGWTGADQLYQNLEIEFADGRSGYILAVDRMYVTEQPNVAWVSTAHGVTANDFTGDLVTIDSGTFEVTNGGITYPFPTIIPVAPDGTIDEAYYLKRRVYNLEVVDDHTYFVGALGIWVVGSRLKS